MAKAFVPSIRWIVGCGSFGCSLVFLSGWLMHLTVRDHYRSTALLFYLTPLVVLAIVGLLASVGWFIVGRRRLAKCFGLATTITVALLAFFSFRMGPSQPRDQNGLRLFYWNTAGGNLGWDGVLRTIARETPDIIAVVESGYDPNIWKAMFPNYETTDISGQILLLSRLPIQQIGTCRITEAGLFKRICVNYDGQPLQIVAVDFDSNPFANRADLFDKLSQHIQGWNRQPLVIVGDFNTTSDSVHLRKLQACVQNAFDTAGRGYKATWPVPVPLIQIDYAWHNHLVEVNSCEYGWNEFSDHRPILLNFSRTKIGKNASQSVATMTSTQTKW